MRRGAKEGHRTSDPQKKTAKHQRVDQDLTNKFTFQEIHASRSKSYRTWTLNLEVKDTKRYPLLNGVTKVYQRHLLEQTGCQVVTNNEVSRTM